MESIKDIIAEMRKDMPRVVDAKVILRNYADRIEEALTNCNQLKMRSALEYLRDASREFCHLILNSKYNEVYDKYKHPEVAKISDAIANAGLVLAEPPRNCDVYTETQVCEIITKEVQNELSEDTPQYLRDIIDIVAKGVTRGLFAEAKGGVK